MAGSAFSSLLNTGAPVYNIMDYGAVGNGSADDTTALNSVLAAASAGGTVFFPVGTYKIVASTQRDIPSNVMLRGAGWSSIVLVTASSANGYIRMPIGNNGIIVQDMTFQRGNATATRLLEVHSTNCTIQNVRFQGNGNAGVALTAGSGGDGLLVTGCLFDTVDGKCFLANAVNGIRIIGNRFSAITTGEAISLNTNVTRFAIVGNEVLMSAANASTAIAATTAAAGSVITHGQISANYVETGGSGIGVIKTSSGDWPEHVAIVGNSVKMLASGSSQSGITQMILHGTVSGNTIDVNGITGLYSGIECLYQSYMAISGNSIFGDQGFDIGIILNGVNHSSVTGNTIQGFKDSTAGRGINLFSNGVLTCSDNVVTGNHIFFPSTAAGSVEYGILVQSNATGSLSDRNVVVGNHVYGNLSTNSRGVGVVKVAGSVDRTLVGMNLALNCTDGVFQSSDTNTLLSGTTWNLTA